jgi:integrase
LKQIKPRKKHIPSNKGKIIGRKLPLNLKQIRAIRTRLKSAQQLRDLALFNLAIDGSLSACDAILLRVSDVAKGRREPLVMPKATIVQFASQRSIEFELTDETQESVAQWIAHRKLKADDYLFPSRLSESPHLSTRQYARIVAAWVESIGLDPANYGTESLRRTKASIVFQRSKDLAAAQSLLGHTRLRSTARFLGIEIQT